MTPEQRLTEIEQKQSDLQNQSYALAKMYLDSVTAQVETKNEMKKLNERFTKTEIEMKGLNERFTKIEDVVIAIHTTVTKPSAN